VAVVAVVTVVMLGWVSLRWTMALPAGTCKGQGFHLAHAKSLELELSTTKATNTAVRAGPRATEHTTSPADDYHIYNSCAS